MEPTIPIKKAWIVLLSYVVTLEAFNMFVNSNVKILRVIWHEINNQIATNPSEITKLISAAWAIPTIREQVLNEEFIAKFLVGVIGGWGQFTDFEDSADMFSVLCRLSLNTSGAVIMCKHREFTEFLHQAVIDVTSIGPHAIQVCINLINNLDLESLKGIFKVDFFTAFKKTFIH